MGKRTKKKGIIPGNAEKMRAYPGENIAKKGQVQKRIVAPEKRSRFRRRETQGRKGRLQKIIRLKGKERRSSK